MSDDFIEDEESGGEEQQPKAGKKRIGFLPAVVIDILKWTAIIVGAIIFIVVVVVLTVRFMNRGAEATPTRLPLQSEYSTGGAELLDWFGQIGDIRGSTADRVRTTFIVEPHIGYTPESDAVLQELLRRQIQIKEAIAVYFSSHTLDELDGVENRQRVKREVRELLNRIMINDVQEVAFARYEFIEF